MCIVFHIHTSTVSKIVFIWLSRCCFHTSTMQAKLHLRSFQTGFSINGGSPIAGWFMRENPIKMDDLGVALFQETSKYVLTSHFPTPQIVLNVSPKTPNQNKISTFFQQPQIFQNHQLSQHFSSPRCFCLFPAFPTSIFPIPSMFFHLFTIFCHISQQFPGIFPGFLPFYSWVSHVFSAAGCEVHNWAQAVSSAEQAGASAVLVFNDLDVQDVGRGMELWFNDV